MNTAAVAKTGGGVATDGSWALINHASDIHSSDLGCYASTQVNFAYHAATLTMTNSGAPFSCGLSNATTGNQNYLSGSMVWKNLAYAPSQTGSGFVSIWVRAKLALGWPAIWLLGGNGNTSSSTGCQYQSINNTWDNVGNCAWSSDAQD